MNVTDAIGYSEIESSKENKVVGEALCAVVAVQSGLFNPRYSASSPLDPLS
jgi:hypothetical protein